MDNVTKRYSKFRFSNGFTEIRNFSRRVFKTYKKPIFVADKKNTKLIAHRGLSSIWRENSLSAFKAAGKEAYWGIETDVHPTSDGKYVIIHDDSTGRVGSPKLPVDESTLEQLQKVKLRVKNKDTSEDGTRIPLLEEYIQVCKDASKISVLELKNYFEKQYIEEIVEIIKGMGRLDDTVFISFNYENLKSLREISPDIKMQFLASRYDKELIGHLKAINCDIDIYYAELSRARVKAFHDAGIKVNCWTVDTKPRARLLIEWGVDYITTNCLV